MKNIMASVILLILANCTQRDKTNLVVVKDETGKVAAEIHYLNDTIKHGSAKYYYTNGEVSNEIEYNNGAKDGWHCHYKPGKILESKIFYREGQQDGETYWYYNNGTIESRSFWRMDKEYGSAYFYYPSGKIKTYRCKDFYGDVFYLIKWDKQGRKLKEEGLVFSPEFYVERYDSVTNAIRVNQETNVFITVAEPPETKATIWMGEVARDGKSGSLKKLLVEKNTAVYSCKFKNPGIYRVVTIGEIKHKNGVMLKRDSIANDITVK